MQVLLETLKLYKFEEIRMIGSFLALKSPLQISLNLIRWSIMFYKFVNPVFYSVLMLNVMLIYLGPIFVKNVVCRNMQAVLVNKSESLVVRL